MLSQEQEELAATEREAGCGDLETSPEVAVQDQELQSAGCDLDVPFKSFFGVGPMPRFPRVDSLMTDVVGDTGVLVVTKWVNANMNTTTNNNPGVGAIPDHRLHPSGERFHGTADSKGPKRTNRAPLWQSAWVDHRNQNLCERHSHDGFFLRSGRARAAGRTRQ